VFIVVVCVARRSPTTTAAAAETVEPNPAYYDYPAPPADSDLDRPRYDAVEPLGTQHSLLFFSLN
jgi:hypothetical protein